MMKNWLVLILLGTVLILVVLGPVGCGYVAEVDSFVERAVLDVSMMGPAENPAMEQMGETKEEVYRRYRRNLRLNRQMMMEDIDTLFHLDQPSQLTDRAIP